MKKSIISVKLFFLSALLLFSAEAYALAIDPTSGEDGVSRWQDTTGPGQPFIDASIAPIMEEFGTSLPELYKADYGDPVSESGALAGSYDTTFSGEPNNATISYMGGTFIGPEAFLLVKGGNSNPVWYLYHLTEIGWDGIETLELSGFWAGTQGAISHVSLYGGGVPVPEPSAMLLIGLGLVGIAGLGRNKLVKK